MISVVIRTLNEVKSLDRLLKILSYQSIKHENIFPVIVCGDAQAKIVIDNALKSVKPVLPSIEKITVHLVH